MNVLLAINTKKKPTIGLTPLIDLVFILLIFFMLVMNFHRYQIQEINVSPRLDVGNKSDTLTIEIINKTKCRFKQAIHNCSEIAAQIPVQKTDLVIRYQAAVQLEDIINWYQYFSSRHPTSLAIPITQDVVDEI